LKVISATAKKEVQASQTGAAFITIVQIRHASLEKNYINNMVDVVYDGVTYEAFPFRFDPAKDAEGSNPESTISFPNIDRELIAALRSISDTVTVKVALIMIMPDGTASKEGGWWEFEMRNISYDMMSINAELAYSLNLDNNVSLIKYNNQTFPGLYG
jgi:hypothetical protein